MVHGDGRQARDRLDLSVSIGQRLRLRVTEWLSAVLAIDDLRRRGVTVFRTPG
jgi:hypothetical protein